NRGMHVGMRLNVGASKKGGARHGGNRCRSLGRLSFAIFPAMAARCDGAGVTLVSTGFNGVVGAWCNYQGRAMGLHQRYSRAMDQLNAACLFVAGLCLVTIILIIPYGVFCRYVLNSAASWPEPMAVLLMIVLSFLSAVVCYREYLHIG